MIGRLLPSRADLPALAASFTASFMMLGLVLFLAPLAHAQSLPQAAPAAPGILGLFASWPLWVQGIIGVVGAVASLATALSFLLGLLGSFWAPALKAAAWCSKAGLELHQLGAWFGSLLGGGRATPNAAMARASEANRGFASLRILALTSIVGVMGLGAFATSGCIGAKAANDVTIGLNAVQQACVDAEQLAPIVDPSVPTATVSEIKLACQLDAFADNVIEQALSYFNAQPATVQFKKSMLAKHDHAADAGK